MVKDSQYTTRTNYLCSLNANWWLIALRGILSIIFGIIAFFIPEITVLAITIIFGVYSIADGIFYLISGINRARKGQVWGSLIVSGVFGIITGLVILIMPQIATIGLTTFLWTIIAVWAIATGTFELTAAIRLRKEIDGEWFMAFIGLISIFSGIALIMLLWFYPAASILTLGLLIGANSLITGIILLLLAVKLRKFDKMFISTEEIVENN